MGHKAHCYHNDDELFAAGAPCICDEPVTTHKPVCHEYWDRGLDCPCIPEGVKDAIRGGANPDDVM